MTPEEIELEQRRKLAEALMARSQERLPTGQMVGRVFVGTNPLQYLAQGLKGYAARKDIESVGQERKALGEKQNQALIEGLRGFQQKMTGAPEKVMPYQAPSFDDADAATMQGNQTVTPAVPADPRAAYAGLIGSGVPMLQQMGVQGMGQLPQIEAQKSERADARAFQSAEAEKNRLARIDQLNMQHQLRMDQLAAQNASKEQMLQAQQQHQMALKQMGASIAAGMRQPPAPALTTIQDPKDPTKSITVDARTYNPATGAGVIGIAPPKQAEKAPPGYRLSADGRSMEVIPGGPADRKATEQLAGKETVDSVVLSLRNAYDALDKGGGINSTAKGPLENLSAYTSRSAVGQAVGGAFGAKNQKERDAIAQARPLLLQAIMKATGMSAKQMDSNAELKLYLATATDPTLSLEANKEALDRIEALYGSGGAKAPAPPADIAAKIQAEIERRARGGK